MKTNMNPARKPSIIPAVLAGAFLLGALILCILLYSWEQGLQTPPSPQLAEEEQAEKAQANGGFPTIDWEYWLEVNPDIIGWITIPNTTIDNPIIQAQTDNPDYYLQHDVFGNYNPYGAIFLDAECSEQGLSSPNAVIMGHHVGTNYNAAPFGIIAEYTNKDFAFDHAEVLIQTPDSTMRYKVRFASIVNGNEPSKRTAFAHEQDFKLWYTQSLSKAQMVLDDSTTPSQVISLVSCSYNIWVENERTVVTTSQEDTTAVSL